MQRNRRLTIAEKVNLQYTLSEILAIEQRQGPLIIISRQSRVISLRNLLLCLVYIRITSLFPIRLSFG